MIITVETLQKMFSFDVTQKYLSKAPEVTNHNFRILLQSFSKDLFLTIINSLASPQKYWKLLRASRYRQN